MAVDLLFTFLYMSTVALAGDVCPQPKQLVEGDMEECSPHHGYDYFQGSELSYIVAFTCLGLVPLGMY